MWSLKSDMDITTFKKHLSEAIAFRVIQFENA